jgi:phosphopantothenoylcysteine decarboxylase/phosphopantothenate--cysteine ligase
LKQNPDILATLSAKGPTRPRLVVGFAAETDNVVANAQSKLVKKGCDWVVANSVSDANPVFGSDENQVYFVTSDKIEEWPKTSKQDVAQKLASRIADFFSADKMTNAAE